MNFKNTSKQSLFSLLKKKKLPTELAYLKAVFLKKNDYLLWAITQLMKEVEETQKRKEATEVSMVEHPSQQEQKVYFLLLIFTGS